MAGKTQPAAILVYFELITWLSMVHKACFVTNKLTKCIINGSTQRCPVYYHDEKEEQEWIQKQTQTFFFSFNRRGHRPRFFFRNPISTCFGVMFICLLLGWIISYRANSNWYSLSSTALLKQENLPFFKFSSLICNGPGFIIPDVFKDASLCVPHKLETTPSHSTNLKDREEGVADTHSSPTSAVLSISTVITIPWQFWVHNTFGLKQSACLWQNHSTPVPGRL